MSIFKIEGGHELKGEITPQGAKNEALQIICATLLTPEKVTISNIPDIRDVNKLIYILGELGVKIKKIKANTYTFQADDIDLDYLESDIFKKEGGTLRYGVEAKKLKGAYMLLDEASVTGTANIIMAAVLAEGETIIYNAACEPYIQQLSKMLVSMGAKIGGIGSNRLIIQGVESLSGCEHSVLPDMIEIGSWIGMAVMTGSELTIKNVSWKNLGQIPNVFKKLGIKLEKINDDIFIPKQKSYKIQSDLDDSILTISDAPWPGFTPDLLSIVLVVATQAKGSVLVHQKMFESRLFFVDKLIDMGAKIILCDPHRATVIGLNHESSLRGTTLTSPDIRAGISLLIAALSATGKSTIHNIEQIDRGYERIDERLRALGAKIERISDTF